MCGLEVVFYFYHHTQSQQLVQVLCAQLSVGATSGQKTPECSGLPAKALVQDVVMGRKGKTEVGRAWCESRWLGGLAAGPWALSHPPCDGVLVPRHRCLAWASGLPV